MLLDNIKVSTKTAMDAVKTLKLENDPKVEMIFKGPRLPGIAYMPGFVDQEKLGEQIKGMKREAIETLHGKLSEIAETGNSDQQIAARTLQTYSVNKGKELTAAKSM